MLAKKCFLVGIFTLLSLSLAISAQPLHPTTGEPLVIDCLRGTPDAIDGDLSDWNLEAMAPAALDAVEQLSSGQDIWTGPEDCSAEFYMLWDDVNIYIAVVVTDDKLSMNKSVASIWNSDCVEVLFATTDADAAHSWTNPTIHYQYGFNANNQRWNWCSMDGPGQSEPDYLQIASSVTTDGYICEASIEYAKMSALDFSAGNTIGFHPCIDDTDIDNGDTEYQLSWIGLPAHDQSQGFGHMVLSADSVPEPEPAPTIAWVSYHAADDEPHADAAAVGFTQAPDIGYTDLLSANGYNVTRVLTSQDPDVEYLNTFDLVIISRTASSGHYSGSGATLWNSVTAPMINLNGYTLRSSRLGFTDGTDMPDTTGDIRLTVTDPTHPIFAGIPLTDGTMDNLYAEGAVPLPTDGTISRGISINNNNLDEEGMVLATVAEVSADTGPVGGMVIAELPAGATMENSSGSPDDVLGGPRLVFLTGSREPSGVTGGQAAALYDLYPDGEQMFLNAVKYMIPVVPVDPGTDGLMAYYPLDIDALDASGNGNDGTLNGDPQWVAGKVGGALEMDGGDFVEVPGAADINPESITLMTWVNFSTVDGADMERQDYLSRGDDYAFSLHEWGYRDGTEAEGKISAIVTSAGGWTVLTGTTLVESETWYHTTLTYDSGTQMLKLYLDGEVEGEMDLPTGLEHRLGGSLTIGTYNGRDLLGRIDEIMIYDRALSEGEILYLAGYRVMVDPVHSYTFEDGTGNDSVGDADGVLVGDAAIVDGSLVVDGNGDWMEMPGDVIAINTYTEMTLELWSTQSVDNPFSMTASFGGTWDNGMGKDYIFIATGRGDQMNRGAIANTPDEVNPWEDEVGVSSPELNDGIEHHYVLTITAEGLAYYVDGVLIGTAPMGDTTISGVSNDFVYLGKGIYSVDATMNCSINEFNIYDVALDGNQIAANYAVGPVK